MTTMENRDGVRASPTTGTYRRNAHGPGMCVLKPAMWTNGPSASAPNTSANPAQRRGIFQPARQATAIVSSATKVSDATFS